MSGKSLYRNGQRELKADTRLVADADAAARAAQRARAAEERAKPSLSRDEIHGATLVFVRFFGWRSVISVNKTTVTVAEPNAWDGKARYAFAQINAADRPKESS